MNTSTDLISCRKTVRMNYGRRVAFWCLWLLFFVGVNSLSSFGGSELLTYAVICWTGALFDSVMVSRLRRKQSR